MTFAAPAVTHNYVTKQTLPTHSMLIYPNGSLSFGMLFLLLFINSLQASEQQVVAPALLSKLS